MTEARAVALALVALLGAFAAAAPATAAGVADPVEDAGVAVQAGPAANDTGMGGQVSSFMHAAAGGTAEDVQSGLWNAAYRNATNRSAVVEQRTADVDARLAALAAEKRTLVEARQNGTITQTEYRARMSAVVGRMAALNRSIDETERQARATGANVSKVHQLRDRTRNMSGPEVADVARSMAGGPPAGSPGGPPSVGPGDGGPPNGTGPPDDGQGGPPDNGSDRGQGGGDKGGGDKGGGNPGGGNPGGDNPGGGNDALASPSRLA